MEKYKQNLEWNKSKILEETEYKDSKGLPISILGIVLTLLTIALLFARFRNSDNIPTFTSLLEWFSGFNAPEIPFIAVENVANLGDWSVAFNWLRDIIYFSIQIVNVLVFMANGIIIVIGYVVHFCQWLFMV